MAALHDLLPPLMAAAHRDLAHPGRSLTSEDVAGIAVLLGLSGDLLARPADGNDRPLDAATLRADAHESLLAVRRVKKGRDR